MAHLSISMFKTTHEHFEGFRILCKSSISDSVDDTTWKEESVETALTGTSSKPFSRQITRAAL